MDGSHSGEVSTSWTSHLIGCGTSVYGITNSSVYFCFSEGEKSHSSGELVVCIIQEAELFFSR